MSLESKTRYEPSEVEPRIADTWLQSGLWHPEPEGTAVDNYSIAIPPPNVTGVLHMGHALNHAVQDTLIRHARQQGKRTKWILGTDHAGIATQTQVEKLIVSEGSTREATGRERFVERVWEWRGQYGRHIIEQIKRLGSSVDFQDERFTFDDAYAKAVLKVFVDLYKKGYIYRDRYLVNWDPGSLSAISDLEVEPREVTDTLYYIDYPLASGNGSVTIATVRPETMLADVAVAVNPDDERYSRLIGEQVILPIVGRRLPIIADDYVKMDFGTGALKITPGHDPNDFEIGNRHNLPHPSVIGEDGRMIGDEIPERYAGLTTEQAQEQIVAELRELGLVNRTESYLHTVPFSHRSGARIEPLISLQWFMNMDELAKPAIEVVKNGQITFHPENQGNVYLNWLENIRPWCVSRQLWWGHQIPVWYRGDEVHVAVEPPEGEGWQRDPDVLDTWFSSGLWPFATLGWPEQTPEMEAFYPTDVLSTGRDIIFLWVARMVMFGLEFTGEIPFRHVYFHSIVQAPDGRRMSKSLGTGIDPRDLVSGGPRPPVFARSPGEDPGEFPAYGADALRWGLLAMSSTQDVRFNEERIAQASQLTNKLWNASRLILMRVDPDIRPQATPVTVEDRWILSRLAHAKQMVDGAIDAFEFSRAALELYDFIFSELCDWYLELVKPRLYDGDRATQAFLLHLLTETVTLAHPLIPFVTEEIWSDIPGADGLLAARTAPATVGAADAEAEAQLADLVNAVQTIRAFRDSAEVKPSAILNARLHSDRFSETVGQLFRLARLAEVSGSDAADGAGVTADDAAAPASAAAEKSVSVPIPGGSVTIYASADLDLDAAAGKKEARGRELAAEIERATGKLANTGFVDKAPAEIVEAERAKLARLQTELKAL